MTASDVMQRLNADIGNLTANRFGWDFRRFLLPEPIEADYQGIDGCVARLWTILIEGEAKDGYHVVFDPESGNFGLATARVWIGQYGRFMETIDAM